MQCDTTGRCIFYFVTCHMPPSGAIFNSLQINFEIQFFEIDFAKKEAENAVEMVLTF